MHTTSSLASSKRKPLTANKRLLGLLTVALIVIALFFAAYYSYIKSNQHHFRESKLQTLDADFDIIKRQLDNDIQSFISQNNIQLKIIKEDSLVKLVPPIKFHIESMWKKQGKSFKLDKAFDEYMVTIKDPSGLPDSTKSKEKANGFSKPMEDIFKSSLIGTIKPPDTLFNSNLLNMGVSIPIPIKETKYQLFGREYNYQSSLIPNIKLKIEIIGLIKADRYNETIRKIDPWIIALLTTFLLLSLFGLPYFKMLFIAEDERLSSNDVILSGISVVLGAPIIIIVFLSVMSHFNDYYHKVPNQLIRFSKNIGERFEKENIANVNKLYNISLQKEDSVNIPDSTQFFGISNKNFSFMNNFKFVTKISKKGNVLYHIGFIENFEIINTKNLSTRPYYKDFDALKNIWQSNDTIKYVMRPVVSIEDQTEEAIYIVNNKNDSLPGYRVGSSQLKSIHDPILPFGYQFLIVDNNGEVWFHSELGRATLENFFEVSRQVHDVRAAVLGRINANGLVNYRDEGKLFNVTPIKGTNLSVIALYDIGLLRTRISEVLTLAFIGIVLAVILILLITILSLIIRNPKLGLYRYDRFLFEFLTPKKKDRDTYILLSILFLGILLIGVIVNLYIPNTDSTKVYITCLLLPIWVYLIVYYTLHPYRNKPDLKFRVRDFLLLTVIFFLNILMVKLDSDNYTFAKVAGLLQLGCLAIIVRGQFFSLPNGIKKLCRYNKFKFHIAYRYWYSIFLFSWLLLAAVFPTYLVFVNSKYLNDQFWSKSDQIYMAQKYMAKEKALEANLPAFKNFDDWKNWRNINDWKSWKESNEWKVSTILKEKYDTLYNNHLMQGLYPVYAKSFKIVTGKNFIRKNKDNDSIFNEFLWHTRPIYDERVSQFKALVYRGAQDSSWLSDEESNTLTLTYLNKPGVVSIIKHDTQKAIQNTFTNKTLMVTGNLIILAILFSLILFFVDRFFAFRFRHLRPNDFDSNQRENYTEKLGKMLLAKKANSGLLLIGLPFSGKRTFAREILESAGYKKGVSLSMLRLDHIDINADISIVLSLLAGYTLKNQEEFNWEKHEAYIIEHLEHNIKSFNSNHIKLKVISFLISKKKRVILVSEVYPSQIFAIYENPPQESSLPWGSFEDDFNSWRNILSAFPQVLIGITENKEKVYRLLGIIPEKEPTKYLATITPLIEELGHSKFLPTLAPIILSKTLYETENPNEKYKRLDRQRMVMHTQNLGHGYYNDIWNALPTRERYMLYDLAKDGFLNIKNRNSLFSLMKKGLVVWKDRPTIFNYSFKNFIMTSVSMNEALRLENKNRGKGTWGNARIILYLIIITTIVFIALGNPKLIKDFEALIGTLGGLGVVIPLVSRFLASGGQK
ncbi:MAG: hypothetical protein R3243_04095 [Arenibacter latericius]|nr:hypothetical protein [Arenibacter latericius]